MTNARVFVRYEVTKGNKLSIPCAIQGLFNTNPGVIADDRTGLCLGLSKTTLDSSKDTYFKKIAIEKFQEGWPSNLISGLNNIWVLPGYFGVGAGLEVHFYIPEDSDGSYAVYLGIQTEKRTRLAEIAMFDEGIIRVYGREANSHDSQTILTSVPNGKSFVAIYEAKQVGLQVSIDKMKTEVNYLEAPENARYFLIRGNGTVQPRVTKIIFQGV
ncbi:hypothetical protein ACF0H5_004901 [Mactra antiquata]